MNKIHSNFKKTHKLLFSAVALLLAICILPNQVLAAEGGTTAGSSDASVTWGNATGSSGRAYGKGGSNWNNMPKDKNGNSMTRHAFMGYRVYVVDDTGALKSTVVDLLYQDLPSGDLTPKFDTQICGATASTNYGKLDIRKTYDHTAVASGTSANGGLLVYSAAYYGKNQDTGVYTVGGGTFTLGSRFASWMQVKDSTGTKNAERIMRYAFGDENADKYLEKENYRLIVEPLMYSDVWTPYEWITVEKSTYEEYAIRHYIGFDSRGNAYDWCCDSSKDDGGTGITRAEYTSWCYNTGNYHAPDFALHYGSRSFLEVHNALKEEHSGLFIQNYRGEYTFPNPQSTLDFNAINKDISKANQTFALHEVNAMKALGFGNTSYNNLSKEQKVKLYEYLNSAEYRKITKLSDNRRYGQIYLTSVKDNGFVYTNSNMITYKLGAETVNLYADWNLAYANDPTHWSNKNDEYVNNGKHYVSAYRGYMLYGTYTNIKEHLSTLTNLNGTKSNNWYDLGGICKDYQNPLGDGFCLSENEELGGRTYAAGTRGIHIYHMTDIDSGKPINTYDIDTNPTVPDESEQPSEPKQNTGKSTIVKVYGKVYRDDTGKYHYIEDYNTAYVTANTTDEIIITDEYEKTGYTLTQWVVSSTKNTGVTATKWAKINSSSYGLDYSTLKSTLGVTAYTMTSTGSGLVHGEDNPLTIGEGNTLYLLYLKTLPAIETSDTKVPDTTTDFEPTNPTYPEVPTGDKKKDPNGYNIIKVYTILDEYNGTPLKSETYTQSSTTPFIKIEQESNWTLAHWYTTNTHKPTVTGEDFFTKATDAQLKAFYENGYNLKPSSAITSVIFNRQKHIIQKSR